MKLTYGTRVFPLIENSVVIGLLTGYNTLRRHLHLMGLNNYSLYKRSGAEDEPSAHTLCECEALASHLDMYIWAPFPWIQNMLKV
jgi:hypothetical protein